MAKRLLTVPVKRRALIARIDRALRKQGRRLRADRRERQIRYMVIDSKRQAITAIDVDVEKLGRELGCLEPWERLTR